jgi:hypothetical protein
VDFLLVSVLVISLAGFITWGALRINSLRVAEAPEATVPSVADALLATPEETLVQTSVLLGPTATDTLPVGTQEEPAGAPTELTTAVEATLQTTLPAISDAPVQVYVTVLQRAWMRATVDGEIEFEGRVLPGSAYAFAGTNQVELLTGNGAALQVFFGREDLGLLGVYGEVVDRVFTPDGLVLPTPTVTPTQSVTIQLTGTVLATETVQPTPEP